jgi:cell division protein FtsB
MRIGAGALIFYLAAHGLSGRSGLGSFMALRAQERALLEETALLDAQIDALQTRAARLRPESLDLDYLEERARITVHAVRPYEKILLDSGRSFENASLP